MFHFVSKHTVIDKSAAANCFFYLYTLFCIWIDSYFYCPIYFPHLIPTCLQMIAIAIPEQYVLFHYNTSHLQEQVFPFLFIKFFWAFMLRSTIHLTTCRGRRILVIYYVKYIIGNTCPLPEDAFQAYPAEASPDRLNFDGFSDNLCEENHTYQVAPSAHRIYK